jgi:hypothetical protein
MARRLRAAAQSVNMQPQQQWSDSMRLARRRRIAPWGRVAVAAAFGAGLLAAASGAEAAPRQAPRWCAYLGGDWGYDCSFYTFEQCMETARGLGNYCIPNPYVPTPSERSRRRY